jgi:hypothetical protein
MDTKSIVFFRTSSMHNGEYISFMSETDRQIVSNDLGRLGLVGIYPLYKDGLTLAQQTYGILRGNPLTEAKDNAENYRDNRYSAFAMFVRNASYDSDPNIGAAADTVLKVIDEIGNPTNLSDSKETAELFNLQSNLQPYHAELRQIGADRRLAELATANEEFIRLQDEWYKAGGKKPSGNMLIVRRQLDPVYRNIVNCINAFAILNGVAAYESFILAHNELIAQYRTIVVQRKAKAKNAVKNDNSETAE